MGKQIVIGIDLGTTVLKAAGFDARSGHRLAQASRRLSIATGADGKREQDPASLDRALRAVLAEIRTQLGRNWNAITGIGLAAQGGSAVMADRHTGKAHSPMMLWNDMRFMPHLPKVAARRPLEYWRQLSWSGGPGWGLARLLWLRDTHPQWLADGILYAGAGDYLLFKMTGVWRQDAGNALQVGCFNVPQRRLDPEPLMLIGESLARVSPLREGHETHPISKEGARFLGLPEGVPVAGPYMDHEAGYLAAAGLSDRPMQCSLGTAWVGNFILPPEVQWTSPFQLVLPAIVGEGWLVVQPLLTGNVTWDWAMQTLLDADHKRAMRKLARVFGDDPARILPPDGLMALPWLNMPNPLWPPAIGGGTFFGMSAATTREDLLRAVACAMAFEMLRVFGNVKQRGAIDMLILGGGASKGAFFRQLLSALFHPLPVRVLTEGDWAGARGAVYAFSKAAARASSTRVAAPKGRFRTSALLALDRYLTLFDRLYADVPAGGVLRLTDNRPTTTKKAAI